jgi:hypothetical protein
MSTASHNKRRRGRGWGRVKAGGGRRRRGRRMLFTQEEEEEVMDEW